MAVYSVSGEELWRWRLKAQQQAIAAQITMAEVDWLLQEAAGLDRLALRLESFKDRAEIPLKFPIADLAHLWQQRLEQRVPVQYLVGRAPWRQFSLAVSPAVLIPRPETEGLIELATAAVQANPALAEGDWADLGTGSGAIAIGLADRFPAATIHAVDYSIEALAIAQANARRLGLADRIKFHQGSWFQPLKVLEGKLSAMVSNPPYIPSAMIAGLQPEVANHEPRIALDGGVDGLDCIRELVAAAPAYLVAGGVWLIEMMAGQAESVVELLHAQGNYRQIQVHRDLAGIERYVMAYREEREKDKG